MGISSDLSEATSLWKKSSLISKSIAIISIILTSSSIASLSDIVFKWKGFILDGINFYNKYIIESILLIMTYLDITISVIEGHIITLTLILLGAQIRISFYEKSLGNKDSENLFYELLMLGAIYAYLSFSFLNNSYSGPIWLPFVLILFYLLFIPYVLYSKEVRNIWFGIIYISIFIILFLSAINKGLTEPGIS